jgi:hypothetical protein
MRILTAPRLIAAVLPTAVLAAAAAPPAGSAAAAKPRTLRTSPASGTIHQTFTLRIPHSALGGVTSAKRLGIGIQFAPRKKNTKVSRNCTPGRRPTARMVGKGSSRRATFRLPPSLMTRHKGTWCTGTYALDVYAQASTSATSGSVIRDLVRAQFVVKPRR